jgi:hypothetical protein
MGTYYRRVSVLGNSDFTAPLASLLSLPSSP